MFSGLATMKQQRPRTQPEISCVEICCFGYSCLQHFWPRIVLRKWLNITTTDSDFSADTDEGDSEFDSDNEGKITYKSISSLSASKYPNLDNPVLGFLLFSEFGTWRQKSRFGEKKAVEAPTESNRTSFDTFPVRRRRVSETVRAQYINTEQLRICVGTWNVGGKLPPDDLDIKSWLEIDQPADIYVLGFQEIVPLNAGNIFGSEDNRPVSKWENIIRDTLNRVRPLKNKHKCYSDPPSPSRFKPLDDIPDIEDEIFRDTDGESDEEIHLFHGSDCVGDVEIHSLDEESNRFDRIEDGPSTTINVLTSNEKELLKKFSLEARQENSRSIIMDQKQKLTKALSGTERIGLSWPEQPLDLLAQCGLERPNSFKSVKSFKAYNSFKSSSNEDIRDSSEIALLADLDLESIVRRKRRSPYVRVVSKQMVGIFLNIWVRRNLRRHIQNVKVSTVGVGAMGYIGNKGSISVSMSIYQTLFCFICTHLTSGEKDGDEVRRNADVREIHRRTQFYPASSTGFSKTIYDHERIIWLGDLNYRINLPYDKTRDLISKKEWSKLVEKDQLVRELRKGRVFDGWIEGALDFPPTYKYEFNSSKYCGEDPKDGRRIPSWCDRILSFGKGMRLLSYKRNEHMLSDHRPVTAIYKADVDIFCHRKLQKALTYTDAELEDEES
ncbi:hypothetical protein GIB67_011383 [Kingdonia uniflora]|uniref:Inositol polyphosphate-related phosphatase domain-containing protein n=1 Tax=Kingdonia uniflora TaxID=39325 RepID=A0A7J7M3Q8_9MAGN|nr:hypothetical protein GIB67_011383 [Kingdonia uniflora]